MLWAAGLVLRLFIASEKHRALVLRLRSAVRPLLLQQRVRPKVCVLPASIFPMSFSACLRLLPFPAHRDLLLFVSSGPPVLAFWPILLRFLLFVSADHACLRAYRYLCVGKHGCLVLDGCCCLCCSWCLRMPCGLTPPQWGCCCGA